MQFLTNIVARHRLLILHVVPILQNLMINGTLDTVAKLQKVLVAAEVFVSAHPKETPFENFEQRLLFFPGLFLLLVQIYYILQENKAYSNRTPTHELTLAPT